MNDIDDIYDMENYDSDNSQGEPLMGTSRLLGYPEADPDSHNKGAHAELVCCDYSPQSPRGSGVKGHAPLEPLDLLKVAFQCPHTMLRSISPI